MNHFRGGFVVWEELIRGKILFDLNSFPGRMSCHNNIESYRISPISLTMGIVLPIEQAKPIAENGISFKPPKFFISLSTSNPHNCSALCGIFRMSSFQRNIMIQINTFERLFCFCGWSSFVCYSLTGMHFEPPHTFTKGHCGPSVFGRHETIQQESKKKNGKSSLDWSSAKALATRE